MDARISSMWYKISSRGCKTLYLGGIYREHTVLNQPDSTESEEQQTARWKIFIEQWQTANRQCIVVGDTNLDIFKWANPDQISVIMMDMVKNDIETECA